MSLTPETTVWNPNRYKGTEYVITYAADGTPSLTKKTADYTGVEYNFAELPSVDTTTTTDATTTSTTTDTTQEQTTSMRNMTISDNFNEEYSRVPLISSSDNKLPVTAKICSPIISFAK